MSRCRDRAGGRRRWWAAGAGMLVVMGSVREYFDVVGGVRAGLHDEPPWWAPAGIAVFSVLVVAVVAVSLALGVDGGGSPESARLDSGLAPLATAPEAG